MPYLFYKYTKLFAIYIKSHLSSTRNKRTLIENWRILPSPPYFTCLYLYIYIHIYICIISRILNNQSIGISKLVEFE